MLPLTNTIFTFIRCNLSLKCATNNIVTTKKRPNNDRNLMTFCCHECIMKANRYQSCLIYVVIMRF